MTSTVPETGQRNTHGNLDPTANVLALVDAAVKRINDLQQSEIRRIDEILDLRAQFAERLQIAESKRIDSIRAVDVAAVAVASERAAAQATVLANQVVVSADALRALVASTAASVALQLQQMQTQLTDRLSLLEKAQYEGKGRAGLSAPLIMVGATGFGMLLLFIIETILVKH